MKTTPSPEKNTQKSPQLLALTGNIGSGKSTALQIFKDLGASILCADLIARELTSTKTPVLQEIVKTFGEKILDSEGALNRALLGEIVFSSTEKRTLLEDILHPQIRAEALKIIDDLKALKESPCLIVYEIPLYYESRFEYPEIDSVALVYAPQEVLIARLVKGRGLSPQEITLRLNAQINIEEKKKMAEHILDNSTEDLHLLKEQVRELFERLKI